MDYYEEISKTLLPYGDPPLVGVDSQVEAAEKLYFCINNMQQEIEKWKTVAEAEKDVQIYLEDEIEKLKEQIEWLKYGVT